VAGQIPGDVHRQGLDSATQVLSGEAAEDLRQREVWCDRARGLGREQRRVDRIAGRPTGKDVDDLLAGLFGDA